MLSASTLKTTVARTHILLAFRVLSSYSSNSPLPKNVVNRGRQEVAGGNRPEVK